MAGKELLLRVEHVKYRTSGTSKSPVGTISIYEDRVEWDDNGSDDKLVIIFNDIRGQRISPPNKTKTQLQICLHNEEQATFVFVSPLGKEEHVKDRDLVKETLQQALISHRQMANQAVAQSMKYNRSREYEAKKKLLEENSHLVEMYKHLVVSKLVSPEDFWLDYYHPKNSTDNDKLGVSGGFLSNIARSEGTNGVKLNLNVETIQSIFRTYPAVERKHLELVPHEMTEQEFWAKFFQSHYFHREKEPVISPDDPFGDCIRVDEAEMQELMKKRVSKKMLDFDYLKDDSILANFTRSVPQNSSSTRAMLVKRFNYHSERVLLTVAKKGLLPDEDDINEAGPSESKKDHAFDSRMDQDEEQIPLESDELRNDITEQQFDAIEIIDNEKTKQLSERFTPEQAQQYANIVLEMCDNQDDATDDSDDDTLDKLDDESHQELKKLASCAEEVTDQKIDMNSRNLYELQTAHDLVAELLKHFWLCYPPTTEQKYIKISRMCETLRKYEENEIVEAERHFGERNMVHCRKMIKMALSRYEMYKSMVKRDD